MWCGGIKCCCICRNNNSNTSSIRCKITAYFSWTTVVYEPLYIFASSVWRGLFPPPRLPMLAGLAEDLFQFLYIKGGVPWSFFPHPVILTVRVWKLPSCLGNDMLMACSPPPSLVLYRSCLMKASEYKWPLMIDASTFISCKQLISTEETIRLLWTEISIRLCLQTSKYRFLFCILRWYKYSI